MWTCLIFTVVAHLSMAQFPHGDQLFDIPTAVLEAELSTYVNSAASSIPCNAALLLQCQHAFNDDLGIQGNGDWHDPQELFAELGRIYETGVAGVIKICNARITFFQCLRDTYDSCINPLTFIQQGFSLQNSFAYVRAMHRLQFACGSGFLTGVQNYQCMSSIFNNTAAANALAVCDQRFNASLHEPNGQICSSLDANRILLCYQNQYIIYCNFPSGWYICEDIRSGVANLCPNLKCYVLNSFANEPQAPFDAETDHRTQGLGLAERSIYQSLPELTAAQEEAENQKAASLAEAAKRRRHGLPDHL